MVWNRRAATTKEFVKRAPPDRVEFAKLVTLGDTQLTLIDVVVAVVVVIVDFVVVVVVVVVVVAVVVVVVVVAVVVVAVDVLVVVDVLVELPDEGLD
jgi:hypothetical protein